MSENQSKTHLNDYELIAFCVGDQEFCIDIMRVREVRGWSEATVLPQTPKYIRGVINLRGVVLPIIDLALYLEIQEVKPTDRNVVIVVQSSKKQIGILVDSVSDILATSKNMIQSISDVPSSHTKNFVSGLLTVNGRMISLITLGSILQAEGLEDS